MISPPLQMNRQSKLLEIEVEWGDKEYFYCQYFKIKTITNRAVTVLI